jgi:hypothetical protein
MVASSNSQGLCTKHTYASLLKVFSNYARWLTGCVESLVGVVVEKSVTFQRQRERHVHLCFVSTGVPKHRASAYQQTAGTPGTYIILSGTYVCLH